MSHLADIREVPHLVEIPINLMGEASGEPDLYADIVEACVKKEAFLFMEDTSFTVLKPEVDKGVKQLLVWVAWSPNVDDAVDLFWPKVRELAQEIECTQVVLWTAIEAINRHVEAKGWNKKFTVWSKDV